jgi:hypothetical protein
MIVLFISGLTAIPLLTETRFLSTVFPEGGQVDEWFDKIYGGILQTSQEHPYLFYGYDWLAFAHFLFAILFIGALKDPVRNVWLYDFGLIACILIVPFALIAGSFRGIPAWWRLIDCSFGIIGIIPLLVCKRKINQIIKKKLVCQQRMNFPVLAGRTANG